MPYATKEFAEEHNIPHNTIQTILIDKVVPITEAKRWLKENGYKYNSYRTTKGFNRFHQNYVIAGSKYYSKRINKYIILVFENYN